MLFSIESQPLKILKFKILEIINFYPASQLPGRGPLMWMMPLHLHVNQNSDYDIMIPLYMQQIKAKHNMTL